MDFRRTWPPVAATLAAVLAAGVAMIRPGGPPAIRVDRAWREAVAGGSGDHIYRAEGSIDDATSIYYTPDTSWIGLFFPSKRAGQESELGGIPGWEFDKKTRRFSIQCVLPSQAGPLPDEVIVRVMDFAGRTYDQRARVAP